MSWSLESHLSTAVRENRRGVERLAVSLGMCPIAARRAKAMNLVAWVKRERAFLTRREDHMKKNSMKKRARALQAETGMSYQAALNKLRNEAADRAADREIEALKTFAVVERPVES